MFLSELAAWFFNLSWTLIGISAAVTALALWRGPTTADRLVAAEMISAIVVASALLAAADTRLVFSLDLALIIAVVGFMGSSAMAGILDHHND